MGGKGGMGKGGRGLKDRSKGREDEKENGVKVEEKLKSKKERTERNRMEDKPVEKFKSHWDY
jgi:hypothetical protein